MTKLMFLKRILKYEILKMPLWSWLTVFILVILLRKQIADLMLFLLPISIGVALIYTLLGQRKRAAGVGFFILYTVLAVAFFS